MSLDLADACLDRLQALPPGPVSTRLPKVLKVPEGPDVRLDREPARHQRLLPGLPRREDTVAAQAALGLVQQRPGAQRAAPRHPGRRHGRHPRLDVLRRRRHRQVTRTPAGVDHVKHAGGHFATAARVLRSPPACQRRSRDGGPPPGRRPRMAVVGTCEAHTRVPTCHVVEAGRGGSGGSGGTAVLGGRRGRSRVPGLGVAVGARVQQRALGQVREHGPGQPVGRRGQHRGCRLQRRGRLQRGTGAGSSTISVSAVSSPRSGCASAAATSGPLVTSAGSPRASWTSGICSVTQRTSARSAGAGAAAATAAAAEAAASARTRPSSSRSSATIDRRATTSACRAAVRARSRLRTIEVRSLRQALGLRCRPAMAQDATR